MADRFRNVDWLAVAAVVFLGANLVHGADHLRTGIDRLTVPVLLGGGAITAQAAVTLALVVRGHPRAALVATVVGLASALQVANAHLLPQWGILSDSYLGESFDVFSWTVAIAEVVAALALGLVGARQLRRRAIPSSA
jgi:hypothetical protein